MSSVSIVRFSCDEIAYVSNRKVVSSRESCVDSFKVLFIPTRTVLQRADGSVAFTHAGVLAGVVERAERVLVRVILVVFPINPRARVRCRHIGVRHGPLEQSFALQEHLVPGQQVKTRFRLKPSEGVGVEVTGCEVNRVGQICADRQRVVVPRAQGESVAHRRRVDALDRRHLAGVVDAGLQTGLAQRRVAGEQARRPGLDNKGLDLLPHRSPQDGVLHVVGVGRVREPKHRRDEIVLHENVLHADDRVLDVHGRDADVHDVHGERGEPPEHGLLDVAATVPDVLARVPRQVPEVRDHDGQEDEEGEVEQLAGGGGDVAVEQLVGLDLVVGVLGGPDGVADLGAHGHLGQENGHEADEHPVADQHDGQEGHGSQLHVRFHVLSVEQSVAAEERGANGIVVVDDDVVVVVKVPREVLGGGVHDCVDVRGRLHVHGCWGSAGVPQVSESQVAKSVLDRVSAASKAIAGVLFCTKVAMHPGTHLIAIDATHSFIPLVACVSPCFSSASTQTPAATQETQQLPAGFLPCGDALYAMFKHCNGPSLDAAIGNGCIELAVGTHRTLPPGPCALTPTSPAARSLTTRKASNAAYPSTFTSPFTSSRAYPTTMSKADPVDVEKPVDIALLEDKLEASSPTLDITLAPARLAFHVAVLCLFIGAFTGVALWGITLPETVYDKVGSSTNADKKTDTYNFRSGLVMAFVEVVMGWWLDKIQPAYIVFLHNLLWSAKEVSAPSKVHPRLPGLQQHRGLQLDHDPRRLPEVPVQHREVAGRGAQERVGRAPSQRHHPAERGAAADDPVQLHREPDLHAAELVRHLRGRELGANQRGRSGVHRRRLRLLLERVEHRGQLHEQDARRQLLHRVLGRPGQHGLAGGVRHQRRGRPLLARHRHDGARVANSERRQHNCSESDGRTDLDVFPNDSISTGGWTYADDGTRICQGPATSLFTLMEAVGNITSVSIDSVMSLVTEGLNKSFPSTFAMDETTLSLEKLSLTDQMSIEALTIDVVLNTSIVYGESFEGAACDFYGACPSNATSSSSRDTNASFIPDYVWSYYSTSFCGNTSCVFYDVSNTFNLQKEVGVIPVVDNCSTISYDANYGGWYPIGCEKLSNQAVIYGIGSYITGDTFAYGGLDGEYEVFGDSLDMYVGPYIVNPRRHIQFSFALVSWQTDPVHQDFDAQCDVNGEDGGDCNGMWYQLPQTKRYLFAGEDVLPVSDIMEGDFHSPTPLVQLNAPSFLIQGTPTELEYLNLDNFANTQWNASLNETLGSDACSSLMESYLLQLEDNRYYLERPLEVMYSSIFFFFMQNAAVTDLTSSSSSSSSSSTPSTSSDLLANVQLKGDRQLRRIAMSIPTNSFWISFVGCVALIAIMFIILIFPTRRAEYFEPGTTTAEKYVALKTDADYPDLVYKKMLVPAKNIGVDSPIMDAFRVESMTLVHRTGERTQTIELIKSLSGKPSTELSVVRRSGSRGSMHTRADAWQKLLLRPDIHGCLTFSKLRCVISIVSIALLATDIPRSGLGVRRLGDYYQVSIMPDTVARFGPYDYPVRHVWRASDEISGIDKFYGLEGADPVDSANVWSYQYDTTSIGLRGAVELLNVTAYPESLLYKGKQGKENNQNGILDLNTTFFMLDAFISAARAKLRVRETEPGAATPEVLRFGTKHFWVDRVYQYLTQPSMISGTLSYTYFNCEDQEIVVLTRGRRCAENDTASSECTTVFVDDYRYEREILQTNVVDWYFFIAMMRGGAQGYFWVRLILLYHAALIAADQPGVDEELHWYSRGLSAVLTVFKIPFQVVVYSSVLPVVGYVLALLLDGNFMEIFLDSYWSTLEGVTRIEFLPFLNLAVTQMRSVWLMALLVDLMVLVARKPISGSEEKLPGIRGLAISFTSALTVIGPYRRKEFRTTEIVRTIRFPGVGQRMDTVRATPQWYFNESTYLFDNSTAMLLMCVGAVAVLAGAARLCTSDRSREFDVFMLVGMASVAFLLLQTSYGYAYELVFPATNRRFGFTHNTIALDPAAHEHCNDDGPVELLLAPSAWNQLVLVHDSACSAVTFYSYVVRCPFAGTPNAHAAPKRVTISKQLTVFPQIYLDWTSQFQNRAKRGACPFSSVEVDLAQLHIFTFERSSEAVIYGKHLPSAAWKSTHSRFRRRRRSESQRKNTNVGQDK
ncbi:hypothetical protein ON010_g883 [Phytophthora cinnamomi]|nr:hypothetical protein ON010_g883 [Phytophthora cinnamomi]